MDLRAKRWAARAPNVTDRGEAPRTLTTIHSPPGGPGGEITIFMALISRCQVPRKQPFTCLKKGPFPGLYPVPSGVMWRNQVRDTS